MLQSVSWSPAAAYLVALAIGYLLGSIPFGLILTRIAGLGDIRAIGSGNIGATNVLRTGRRELALLTLLGDGLKGTIAVFAAATLAPYAGIVAGFAAFIGHVFPLWLRFRGGKGFATYLGVLAGLFWPAAIVSALVWFVTAVATRYSSASALAASLATPLALLAFRQWEIAGLFVVLTAILWVKHSGNIRRLIAGTEGRIGEGR